MSEHIIRTDDGLLVRVEILGARRPLTRAMLRRAFATATAKWFPGVESADKPERPADDQEIGVLARPGEPIPADREANAKAGPHGRTRP